MASSFLSIISAESMTSLFKKRKSGDKSCRELPFEKTKHVLRRAVAVRPDYVTRTNFNYAT
jgi:hypothetical protein